MNIETIFFTLLSIVAVIHLLFLIAVVVVGYYLWKKLNLVSSKIGTGITALSLIKGPAKLGWLPLAFSAFNWWRRRNR